jgi:type I restriction enzyme S subunit
MSEAEPRMNTNNHELKTPQLRFPEFSGEWVEKQLGDFLSFKNGLNAPKEAYGAGYKFINVLDIINNPLITHDSIIGSVDVSPEEFAKNIVEYGDILFQRSSETREEVGQANVYLDSDRPATFGGFVIRGKMISEYEPIFMNLLLKTSIVRNDMTSRSGGSTRYNIGQDSISQVQIHVPNGPEQKKIAGFLGAVDRRIEGLEKKRDLLKEYKKGLMQKLFNQSLRFSDDLGHPFPDWELLRGKAVFLSHTNKKHNGDLPILAATQENGMVYRSGIGIDIKSSEASVKTYKIVEPGDFVISLRSFQGGIEHSDLHGICSPAYIVLKPRIDIEVLFFKQYFKKGDFIERLSKTVVGIRDGKQITYDAFSGLKLHVPSIAEQRKIADCLSAVDRKIAAVGLQVDQSRAFKQGLLQRMFV